MPASGVYIAPALGQTRDRLRRDGGRSSICSGPARPGIHLVVREPCGLPPNQTHDSLGFDRPPARTGRADIDDAKTEGSRRASARDGLPHMRGAFGRIWAFVKPHSWMLVISLFLVGIVGLLEAVTPFLIALVFDTVLVASATPTISRP